MRLGASIYRGLTQTLSPASSTILRLFARGEPAEYRAERLARLPMEPVDTWWHAASLGEVAALEPILTRAVHTELAGKFLVTTTTVAGRRRAAGVWGDRVSLAPLDLPGAVERGLEARRPRSWVVVETELWPNWLYSVHRRKIRVGIVNGRISARSWPRYRRLRSIFAPLLRPVRSIAARGQRDAERFLELGADPEAVRVTGNSKHDRLGAPTPALLPWNEAIVWTVGSLRPGEESLILSTYADLVRRHPRLRLVLVPRHPDAWPDLIERVRAHDIRTERYAAGAGGSDAQALVVDSQGGLGAFYAASDLAWVGGTWVPVGGHNPVEPALCGVPVLFGPHTANVSEDALALVAGGGGIRIEEADQLKTTVEAWLTNPETRTDAGARAKKTALQLRGASDRCLRWLKEREVLTEVGEHGF